ncbi:TIGR04141 family sporadically distributed protein [Planococcus maritimus]|uniref:TIGR04141 family sporadically distributed protein n=1 Tax=Planococcus maritimus TaxID=192421 RepID=A0A7D7MC23_PLAMR|nr:DUF6119 family protein [Planococcus maritimus]QMT18072.1 TIGR04141 family sporadically distributed protein [Planococcus maritimus]
MEANVFKIDLGLNRVRALLLNEGFELFSNRKRVKFTRDIEGQKINKVITCEFYYKDQSKNDETIPWLESWETFFEFKRVEHKFYSLNYGCILVNIDNTRYIISYGRAHQTIRKISNPDFGLDIAEKILDPNKISIKNSAYINNNKSRSYTQFKENGYLISEIGESNNQVTGKISVDFENLKLYNFKENLKFSSSIKIVNKEIKNQEMIEIIGELHYINKSHETKSPLPRMNIINNQSELKKKLTKQLMKDIYANEYTKFSLQQLIENNGNMEFPFSEGLLSVYYLKPYNLEVYSLEEIIGIVTVNQLNDIESIKIKNISAKESINLLNLLDYSTEMDGEVYSLYEGKWAKLNHSFITFLENQVQLVNQITQIDESYNLTDEILDEGKRIMKSDDKYDDVKYDEYPYNIYLEHQRDLMLLDRKSDHKKFSKVEFGDLYDFEDKKLTHVKIGSNSEFRVCVSQSLNSSRIYNTDQAILVDYDIKEVRVVEMLLLTRLKKIMLENKIDFNRSMSLNLKLELVTWFQYVKQLNYTPRIIVAKDMRT